MSKELTPELLGKLSILVVDHNRFSRGITCDLLRQMGVGAVRHAEDAAAAKAEIQAAAPDAMLTERDLPDLDGVGLTRWIRTNAGCPTPCLPVIMITARTTQEDVLAAREAGVTEFIVKPVNAQVIVLRLRSALLAPREFVRTETYVGPSRRRGSRTGYQGADRRR
jgi:DNA-binding response OmpR family regulator